jgi:putative FmdB family regulatory protein
MPLYDCQCPKCGKVAEQLLKRDEAPKPCECGGETERTVTQLTNFALTGGGWFKDGYSKGKGSD